tara:strand:+ start:13893 stop:14138 length:246 start_codon:yes stop_codon:yes gene_type:complete
MRVIFDILAFPFRAFNWLWQVVWTLIFKIIGVSFKILGWAIWLVFWIPVFILAILGNGWAMGFCFGSWHEQNNQANRTRKD